jgi:hypothetical protein
MPSRVAKYERNGLCGGHCVEQHRTQIKFRVLRFRKTGAWMTYIDKAIRKLVM